MCYKKFYREKLYQELGLDSLKQRRWFRKLCYFFNITKNQSPKYLFDKIPTTRTAYRTRNNIGNISRFKVKHSFFKNSFFPSTLIERNNLDKSIRSSEVSHSLGKAFYSSHDQLPTGLSTATTLLEKT